MKYGEVIRKRRMSKGITLRKFAAKCGITPTTLSALENDKYPPSKETLSKIAEQLATVPVFLTLEAITADDVPESMRKEYLALEKKIKAFVESPD